MNYLPILYFLELSLCSSNIDDIRSLTTTVDYENQLCLLVDNKNFNEESTDTGIEAAEEADIIDFLQYWKNIKKKNFLQKVNVLDVVIKNSAIFVFVLSNVEKQFHVCVNSEKYNETDKATSFLKANVVGASSTYIFI